MESKFAKRTIGLLVVILILVVFLLMYNREVFVGEKVKEADHYSLQFTSMNQMDMHSMSLKKDDSLKVESAIERGQVDLYIGIGGEKPIYTGNTMDIVSFEVIIPADGDYEIIVDAKHASGVIDIVKSE